MKAIKLLLTVLFIMIIGLQIHEYQHYKDFKDLECSNIKYKIIKVEAYCKDVALATQWTEYRDKQILTLWTAGETPKNKFKK